MKHMILPLALVAFAAAQITEPAVVPAPIEPAPVIAREFTPLDENLKHRGSLMITIPHDEVEIFVNGTKVTVVPGSRSVILNGLKAGVYEIRSISDGKSNVEMITIETGTVSTVKLDRVHDRNYFCITPSWSVLSKGGKLSVGPTVDVGWIYDNKIYFGLDWTMLPFESFGMGGMFRVGYYKPIGSFMAAGVGMNTGYLHYEGSGNNSYSKPVYDSNGKYLYSDYEDDSDRFFGGANATFMIGRGILNGRFNYDLHFTDELEIGHQFKLGMMIKL